jgi:NADPH:quinone reductase-like Zn-dependent oxidoreductase
MAGGGAVHILQTMLLAPVLSLLGKKKIRFMMAKVNRADLDHLAGLLVAGTMVSVIDRRYPLRDAAEAIRYLEEGHAKGKIVITMEH